jgi:hypothetical protein
MASKDFLHLLPYIDAVRDENSPSRSIRKLTTIYIQAKFVHFEIL